jgi:hypothetical protein
MFQGKTGAIMPALMSILGGPLLKATGLGFEGLLGLTSSALASGGVAGGTELARQQLAGEDMDTGHATSEAVWNAIPAVGGKMGNVKARGVRNIQQVVAEGLPMGPSEEFTGKAIETGVKGLDTKAMAAIRQKFIVPLEQKIAQLRGGGGRGAGAGANTNAWGAGNQQASQIQALEQKIAGYEEFIKHLESLPLNKPGDMRMILREGGPSVTMKAFGNQSGKLARGQWQQKYGGLTGGGIESALRALLIKSGLDNPLPAK